MKSIRKDQEAKNKNIYYDAYQMHLIQLGRVERKSAFDHEQHAQIQIILRMRQLSSGP